MIHPVPPLFFAVIGHPVGHSLSPLMMSAAFRALGVEATYSAFDVDSLEEDLPALRRVGLTGLSVTIPHKESAFRLVESMDETASAIGAVNTLKRTETGWEGRNTDWIGAVKAIQRLARIKGARALVLGAGGAARAVAYGLKRAGASVTVSNRGRERGEALAGELECPFVPLQELGRPDSGKDFEIVTQCTSVGLEGSAPLDLLPVGFFHADMTVMDSVYKPMLTPFLKSARKAGARVVPGHDMLLFQGVAQLEWWLETTLPKSCVEAMHSALVDILGPEDHDHH